MGWEVIGRGGEAIGACEVDVVEEVVAGDFAGPTAESRSIIELQL